MTSKSIYTDIDLYINATLDLVVAQLSGLSEEVTQSILKFWPVNCHEHRLIQRSKRWGMRWWAEPEARHKGTGGLRQSVRHPLRICTHKCHHTFIQPSVIDCSICLWPCRRSSANQMDYCHKGGANARHMITGWFLHVRYSDLDTRPDLALLISS